MVVVGGMLTYSTCQVRRPTARCPSAVWPTCPRTQLLTAHVLVDNDRRMVAERWRFGSDT